MSNLIIVEGVDSTGKSTLSKFLAKHLNAMYWHSSGHRDLHDSMDVYHEDILGNIKKNIDNGHRVVLDRHWPSQYVYGKVLRPHQHMTGYYPSEKMNELVKSLGGIYVYCHSDFGWERYEETHKDHDAVNYQQLTFERYHELVLAYNALFRVVKHVPYNIEEHGMRVEAFAEAL